MKHVLSIQMQSVGHKTYGELLRKISADFADIRFDCFWAADERSASTKMIRKLAETRIPLLNRANLDFRRARAEWSTGRMSAKLAAKKLETQHYDALHFHTQSAAYGSLGLMKNTPSFITIDMTAFQLMQESNAGFDWTYYPNLIMERRVFAAAAHIIAFSEWARQSVIAQHHIHPDRVSTITPGVKIESFAPPEFEREGKPKILFVGNDFIRKGGDDLLAVFIEKFSDVAELHLVTNDPLKISNPSVFIHPGIVAYSAAWHKLYADAGIFVMASRAEALGMVFQEAAAAGLALIGTTVGGIPEMITNGENGFLITPGDRQALACHLQLLIGDNELRRKMRHESRVRALRDFNANINVGMLMNLIKRSPGIRA